MTRKETRVGCSVGRPEEASDYPRRWAAAAVMIAAVTMDLIDLTIVNVALPTIRADLHASPSQLEWVVSAYMLSFAALLIVAGATSSALSGSKTCSTS